MPIYVALSKLTEEGRKTLKGNEERIREVNEEIKEMGGEVKSQYAVFGRYDFVTVLEVPDAETMSKIAVEIGARGSVKIESMQALEIDDLIESIEKI